MAALEGWLAQATRRLSRDSAAQVRSEITDHYESAREEAIADGVSVAEADRLAVAALGDPREANCRYCGVLLTSAEAKLLREGNWEARVICSRPWVKWMLLALPLVVLCIAATLLVKDKAEVARTLFVAGLGMGLLFVAPFLPVYTQWRGRVFRAAKWVVFGGVMWLAYGPDPLKLSWLFFSCLWPVVWIEWRRYSIRRKLPVEKWPKQLYL